MEIDFCPIDPTKKCNCPGQSEARIKIEAAITFFMEHKGCETRDAAIAMIMENADPVFRATFVFPNLANSCDYSPVKHL